MKITPHTLHIQIELARLREGLEKAEKEKGPVEITIHSRNTGQEREILNSLLSWLQETVIWKIDSGLGYQLPSTAQQWRRSGSQLAEQLRAYDREHGGTGTEPKLEQEEIIPGTPGGWAKLAARWIRQIAPKRLCLIVRESEPGDAQASRFIAALKRHVDFSPVLIVKTKVAQCEEDQLSTLSHQQRERLEQNWSKLDDAGRLILGAAAQLAEMSDGLLVWDAEFLLKIVAAVPELASHPDVSARTETLVDTLFLGPEDHEFQAWCRSLNSGEEGTQMLLSFTSRAVWEFIQGRMGQGFLQQVTAGAAQVMNSRITELSDKLLLEGNGLDRVVLEMNHSAGQLMAHQALWMHQKGLLLELDEEQLADLFWVVAYDIDASDEVMDVDTQYHLVCYALAKLPGLSLFQQTRLQSLHIKALFDIGARAEAVQAMNDWTSYLMTESQQLDDDRVDALGQLALVQRESEHYTEPIVTRVRAVRIADQAHGMETAEAIRARIELGRELMRAQGTSLPWEARYLCKHGAVTVFSSTYQLARRVLGPGARWSLMAGLGLAKASFATGTEDEARQLLRTLLMQAAKTNGRYGPDVIWDGVRLAADLDEHELVWHYGRMLEDRWVAAFGKTHCKTVKLFELLAEAGEELGQYLAAADYWKPLSAGSTLDSDRLEYGAKACTAWWLGGDRRRALAEGEDLLRWSEEHLSAEHPWVREFTEQLQRWRDQERGDEEAPGR